MSAIISMQSCASRYVGPPATRGSHARSDVRIEKIDIEADVQMRVAVEPGERLLHRLAHAHLVDVAHVEHIEALVVDEALLASVDAADADLPHARRC